MTVCFSFSSATNQIHQTCICFIQQIQDTEDKDAANYFYGQKSTLNSTAKLKKNQNNQGLVEAFAIQNASGPT